MSHLDPSSLAQYNSLVDPNLQSYFSNERIRSHLKHAGLITGRGELVPEGEYRTRLTRIEHKKHVRHMLAENIVNRAIDMERQRQAEMRRQFEVVAKAALVNNVKESRRRSGAGLMPGSMELDLLPLDSNWPQTRPKSAHDPNQSSHELARLHSGNSTDHHYRKSSSKARRRSKARSSSAKRSLLKQPDSSSSPCEITMVYYGPKIQVDYDHLVFEPVDEIIVMQQHCGGENIIAFKANLRPGAEFTFPSRRHSAYPFGLTFYVKGFIDSRISTCCEYKHRHGVRLGGDRGHFAIKSVHGSKPCIKCRFAKQARLKKYARSPKEKSKAITISLPVADEPKRDQPPVQIPVRRASLASKNTYEEDFDGSEKQNDSTDSSTRKSKKRPTVTKRKSSSSSEHSQKKRTWQVNISSANVPREKNLVLQLVLMGRGQTENEQISFEKFSKKNQVNSFSVQLKDIGTPKQIKVKILKKNEDEDDEDEDIKWNLNYIELVDLENQSRLKFTCLQPIRFAQEKLLQLSPGKTRKSSSDSSRSSSPSPKSKKSPQKPPASARSSTSSTLSKSSPKTQEMKVSYRVIVHPSSTSDGDFHPTQDAKLFIRLNNQTKETYLTDKSCPTFVSGKEQSFDIDLILTNHDKPTKLTFGYINSDITAKIWKIKKIILINLKTNEQFIFHCQTILRRNDRTNRAEQTFAIQTNQSDSNRSTSKDTSSDEKQPTKTKQKSPTPTSSSDEHTLTQPTKKTQAKDSSDEERQTPTPKKTQVKDSSDEEKQIQIPKKQQAKDSSEEEQEIQKKQSEDSDEEQTPTPKKRQVKDSSDEEQPTQKKDSEEEKERKQERPSSRTENAQKKENWSDEERTPRNEPEKSSKVPSPKKLEEKIEISSEQKPTKDASKEQRSPSFQSMKEDEANYRTIFRQLDPSDDLKLGSPPQSPTTRPKTRRGRQDQPFDQEDPPPVEPLVNLDDLQSQTDRSTDQRNLSSFPSTATTTENRSKRQQQPPLTSDDNDENHLKS